MKLKYLLPVATIASVATIVTPLVTSCAEKEWDASWVKDTEYKPLWTPKAEQKIEGTDVERLETLTQLYHDDIKRNPSIYSDDYVNFLSGEATRDLRVITLGK